MARATKTTVDAPTSKTSKAKTAAKAATKSSKRSTSAKSSKTAAKKATVKIPDSPKGSRTTSASSPSSSAASIPTSTRRSRRQPTAEELDALAALWDDFKETASSEARERLILHYAPLVKYVASKVATGLPASVEQADLVSYGMFGLIDGLEKFEPGRGNKFETYAIPRIRGAIIDELRAMDWVPRSVRFKAREIEKAYSDLETMLKRAPSETELAERLGVSLSELHDVVNQISFVSVLALDEMVSVGADRGEQVSLLDTLADKGVDPAAGMESHETRGLLAHAINNLSEREKIVVTLYYFEGLTLAEIGEILGVTESRVCQIHTKAVGGLRLQFTDDD
jgi:RNA polymerase sigma factor for flagellar operon FliA